jgi:hypothetical protein
MTTRDILLAAGAIPVPPLLVTWRIPWGKVRIGVAIPRPRKHRVEEGAGFRACSCLAAASAVAMAVSMSACSSSTPISVNLDPSSRQAIDQGQTVALKATVTNDSSQLGVTWSLTGPGSLSNPTSSSVTYNSPTTILASAQSATVTATSIKDTTKGASLQVTVNPDPQIPFQTLANGSAGTAYSQTIALTGGTPPFQWSVYDGPILTGYEVGGSVPDGLTLNANTGTISGTPTAGGTWYFEAAATDAAGMPAINGLMSIQIDSTAAPGNPVPFLNQTLVPTAVSPGSTGLVLKVTGTGFVSGATVDFNGAPLTTTFLNNERLSAVVPAPNLATGQTASITVVNPAPGGGKSNVVYFPVAAPESAVNFVEAPNSPLQSYLPFGLAAADFNEDGKPDLAVAASIWVYVFLGNGDGTFASASGSPFKVESPPYNDGATPDNTAIVAADFSHRGHPGLAVADQPNDAAYILLGNGNGTFVPSSAAFANSGGEIDAMAAADFNADGNLDIAFDGLVVLGYGVGAFSAAGNLYASGIPNGLALGDFNQDGKLDAIVASGYTAGPGSSGSGLAVSLGNGNGTFTPGPDSPFALGVNLQGIVAADFNNDGKLDLAVTDSVGNTVIILLGNGDGTFGAPLTISVGKVPTAIVAADFNNDGKLDLAVANNGDNTVTLLLGNGDGTFTPSSGSPYPVGQGPYVITAADFNGDGRLDLAVANTTDNTVSILLQQ